METIYSSVLKTEKQEVINENGDIEEYTLLYLPSTAENNKMLFADDVLVLAYTQREGSAAKMELNNA
jgi:hypothetical protein